jgi:hypothetical protein
MLEILVAAVLATVPVRELRNGVFVSTERLRLDDRQMASGFARAVDPERKHELIFFYSEALPPGSRSTKTRSMRALDRPSACAELHRRCIGRRARRTPGSPRHACTMYRNR